MLGSQKEKIVNPLTQWSPSDRIKPRAERLITDEPTQIGAAESSNFLLYGESHSRLSKNLAFT